MASAGVLRGRPRGRGARRRWVRSSSARGNSAGPSGRPLCVQRRIDQALGVAGQKESPAVAALRHMMRHVRNHHSSYPRHRQSSPPRAHPQTAPRPYHPFDTAVVRLGRWKVKRKRMKRVNMSEK